jgi:hypothetical protein
MDLFPETYRLHKKWNRQNGLYLHIEIQVILTLTIEAQIKISKLQTLVVGCIPSLTVSLPTCI